MAESITLYDLAPSPNNMKIRVALNYKGLPFTKVPVDSSDRAEVIKVSGQPLTPVLLHGKVVVFDSAAILRYLDGNFRETPRLFSSDYAAMSRIEEWERFGRGELEEPIEIIFTQFFAKEKKAGEAERATKILNDSTAKLEKRLSESAWLAGDAMTAADVTAAPAIYYGMLPREHAERSPLHKFFASSLKLGDGRDRTRAWVTKVMAYDR